MAGSLFLAGAAAAQQQVSWGNGYKDAESSFRAIAAHNGRSVVTVNTISRTEKFDIEMTVAQGMTSEPYFYGVATVNNRSERPYCVYPVGNLLPFLRSKGETMLWTQARTGRSITVYHLKPGEFRSVFIGRLNGNRALKAEGRGSGAFSVQSSLHILAWPQTKSSPEDPCKHPPINAAKWRASNPTESSIWH